MRQLSRVTLRNATRFDERDSRCTPKHGLAISWQLQADAILGRVLGLEFVGADEKEQGTYLCPSVKVPIRPASGSSEIEVSF